MLLNELFNTNVQFRKIVDGDDVNYATRLPDGTMLKVMFMMMHEGEYELTFARGQRADFSDASFDKTGMGGEAAVFSAVVQCIGQFTSEYQPDALEFTASKQTSQGNDPRNLSRTSLYAALVKRLRLPGYQVKTTKYNGFDEYKLVRQGSQAAQRADRFQQDFGDNLE